MTEVARQIPLHPHSLFSSSTLETPLQNQQRLLREREVWPEIAPCGSSLRADHRVALAERPSSSPRPEVGEVYTDAVLLVWKPVESCGPVTYIVQCCIEGTGFPRLRPLRRVDT